MPGRNIAIERAPRARYAGDRAVDARIRGSLIGGVELDDTIEPNARLLRGTGRIATEAALGGWAQRRACTYATLLTFFFLIFGTLLLEIFDVPVSMVRIVGDIILMRIGFSLFRPAATAAITDAAHGADADVASRWRCR